MRKLWKTIGCSMLMAACTWSAYANANYPNKSIRFIVPYAAGGSTDTTARLIAKGLGDQLGQTIVVENRVGAGGTIGQDAVSKAAADGYTLLFSAAGPLTVTPHAYSSLPYDPKTAFTPIKLVAQAPLVLVANPELNLKSVQDLVTRAKDKPGVVSYASFGVGSAAHLAGELFKSLAGVDVMHVPYKGSAPGLIDVIGGQVDVMFDVVVSALPHVQAGKLVPLAITLSTRSQLMPDVPTMQEAGVNGFEAGTWFGLLGPQGLPDSVVTQLSSAMDKVLADEKIQEALIAQGADVAQGTPDDFAKFFLAEYEKWGKVAKIAGLQSQ